MFASMLRRALLLLVVTLTLFACKDNKPTGPGGTDNPDGGSPSGKISYGTPGGDVYEYDFATRKARKLADGGEPYRLANGEMVYVDYGSALNATVDKIVIANAIGSSKTKVVEPGTTAAHFKPQASPDGQYISFTYYARSFNHLLYEGDGTLIYQRDGTPVVAIDSLWDGVWLPDGRMLLAGSTDAYAAPMATPKQPGLYIVSQDLSSITRIDPGLNDPPPMYPSVSPDGSKVAFTLDKHIWMMNIDGTGLRQVTTGTKEESFPVWSPDGKWIAMHSYGTFEASFYSALAVVPANASQPIALTNDSPYWPRDEDFATSSSLGRLNSMQGMSWR